MNPEWARKILDIALNGMYILDLTGGIDTFVNAQFTGITGYTLNQVRAMTDEEFLALFHPQDRERVLSHWAALKDADNGEAATIEYRFRRADGQWIWCLARNTVLERDPDGTVHWVAGTFLDISARKRAEHALRQSEVRYQDLMQSANSAILLWTADGTLTFANDNALELFGYAAEDMIGQNVGIILPNHETTGQDLSGLVQDVVEHPERYRENLNENVSRDGRRLWMLWTNRPMSDEYGAVVEVLSIGSNITERIRAETALRRSEERLRWLIDGAPFAMAMFDRDMCYIAASRRFIMDYRLDVDHLVGRSHYEVFPEIPEHWRQIHRRCLDGAVESSDGEPFVRGDGSVDWVRWSIQPLRDAEGAIGGIIMFTEDISASKRVADALRLSEERLRLAVEATGLGSYDYDARKCSSVWSSQLYDLIGLPKSTRMTREQGLSVVHPEDRNRVARLFEEVLDLAGPGVFDLEYRVVRQDGAVRWWRDQGRAFFEGEGKTGRATRVVGTVQDITEQKQAEEALREANRLKDEFLATLAHELRNPLAPIQSGIDALHLRCADPQVGGRILGMMQRQISHLVRLVDDLLDVSRVTRGRITLRKEPVDVGEIIRRAVEISDAGADALQHRQFSIVVPPLKLVVEADPVRLVQVVANLLDNALKYTADGGRIGIAAALEDGQARIAIEDDGVGMAPDTMDQMFEMFAQADPGRGSGLGIGLTLARELVQLHGGTIEGRSQGPGQGSQFIVRLPLTRDPGREPEPPAGGALAPPVRDRVLVVDDNPDVAEALGVLLEVLGTDVRAVHDGAAALDIFDKFRPRIVFLDLGMPNLDGYEVARRIRARDSSGQVILVALTGWSQEGVRQRVEAAGFDHYLIKPTKIETLQQILVGAPRADRRGHHP